MLSCAMKKAIAYYRVSTEEQEESGLGLEAQADAVKRFAVAEGYTLVEEFSEQRSGKDKHRPIMMAALARCKKERATLIVAKLDRLARNVAFTANLMESKAEFRVVDLPTADKLQMHIKAVFDEYERDVISQRTKAALAALKRRGVKLGRHGAEVLAPQNAAAADQFARDTQPTIETIRGEGFKSIRAIMAELNRRNVPTYRTDGKWHYPTVRSILKRIAILETVEAQAND